MVFWKSYPLQNIFKSIFPNIFESLKFEREALKSPTGEEPIYLNNQNSHSSELNKISLFLQNNFGDPPATPIFVINGEDLLGLDDHIIYVTNKTKDIVGCIRYHYLGEFYTGNHEKIYCVDCFCIAKEWRKKGVGDFLLTTLHIYVNNNNIPYCLFLKEGRNLSIVHIPHYSSIYVYRSIENIPNQIKYLTTEEGSKLLNIFNRLNPNTFIIYNPRSKNQIWRLYQNNLNKILVCFQDTFQRFQEDGKTKKIAWATAWIESPNISDEERAIAAIELSNSLYPLFDYVWLNKEWVGKNCSGWKLDGSFHWYLYQWTTSVSIKKSYCILN